MTYCPLDLVENYLRRFVAYPSDHALVAHTLWIAHTHLIECADTTPRLAFMSAEKASGKTRALEVTELFVPDPLMAFSLTPAVAIRLVSQSRRTLLYDEVDAIFGSAKRQEVNGDICAFLNAGYRRGAKAYRCTASGKKIETEEFDAFAAVAVAGLRELPDTLASRAIIIRMKRRSPGEQVEQYRLRYHVPEAKPIRKELAEWCKQHEAALTGAEPQLLPIGMEDRAVDCWEPLIAIADAAGNDWGKRARLAAAYLAAGAADETLTSGVELLSHIREAFGAGASIWTKTLIDRLCERDESPWKDIRGKPLDDRGLASRLRNYGVKSKDVKINGENKKGYYATDFADSWSRYLSATSATSATNLDNKNNLVAQVAPVALIQEDDAPEPGSFEPDEGDFDGWRDMPDSCRRYNPGEAA